MPDDSTYPLHRSPLFRCPSPHRLAKLLPASLTALEGMAEKADSMYRDFEIEKKDGSRRPVADAHEPLKIVQTRLKDLLGRIETPDFVLAPKKGKSYVDNARRHIGQKHFRLLDIEDFFPSCTQKRVFWFFNKVLECPSDVAALLAKLTCRNGALPQGSPCSPILAYWAYSDAWNEIGALAKKRGYVFTLYADDLTFSGLVIREVDIWHVKRALVSRGLLIKASKERSVFGKAAPITGCVVEGDEILLPNRQHRKMSALRHQVQRGEGNTTKARRSLKGCQHQAVQVLGRQL